MINFLIYQNEYFKSFIIKYETPEIDENEFYNLK